MTQYTPRSQCFQYLRSKMIVGLEQLAQLKIRTELFSNKNDIHV